MSNSTSDNQSSPQGNGEESETCPLIHIEFIYEKQTRVLSAVLTEAESGSNIDMSSLKSMLRDGQYDGFNIDDAELEKLLARIGNGEQGTFPIAEKPEYTTIKLVLDEENNILNAYLIESEEDPKQTLDSLKNQIQKKNFNDFLFIDGALEMALKKAGENDREVVAVAECKDADATIEISSDDMTAWITTTEAMGGKRLTQKRLAQCIRESDLHPSCLLKPAIKEVLSSDSVSRLTFAEGVPPEDGEDSRFEALVETVIYHGPVIAESGKADHRNIQDFVIVDVGEALMRRLPATPGVNGIDVKGRVVSATMGQQLPFSADSDNTEIDSNDENVLVATVKGHPSIMETGVAVDQTLKLDSVDAKVGNVTFDGSLLVMGDVNPGMEVNVTGDVIVKGVVDNGQVVAQNNILVCGGVFGQDPDETVDQEKLTTILSAGGNIQAQFISLTQVDAGTDVIVAEYISHSPVNAQGKILVGQDGGKGCIFGGVNHAVKGIVANELGNDASVRTILSAGVRAELLAEQEMLNEKRTVVESQIEQLNDVFQRMEQKSTNDSTDDLPADDETDKAQTIGNTIAAIQVESEQLSERIDAIKAEIKSTRKSNISAVKRVYPNIIISVNTYELKIRLESEGGRFINVKSDVRWMTHDSKSLNDSRRRES